MGLEPSPGYLFIGCGPPTIAFRFRLVYRQAPVFQQGQPLMGDDPKTTGSGAIFISFASQDAAAALRIAEALTAEDLDVWCESGLRTEAGKALLGCCEMFLPVV